jgi:hypothetical protein
MLLLLQVAVIVLMRVFDALRGVDLDAFSDSGRHFVPVPLSVPEAVCSHLNAGLEGSETSYSES